MFGLMKPANCGADKEVKADYRLHYCGTCKTIGSNFSHKSRLLLNNDIVFLGQLLSVISGETLIKTNWDKAYFSSNCLTMPKISDQTPISLKFAATLNIILSELKIDDNITDAINKSRFIWKLGKKFLSKEFRKAEQQMKEWNFSVDSLWNLVQLQKNIESENAKINSGTEGLKYFSETTAQMTGISFEKGVEIVGKAEYSNNMYKLGSNFGRIVYILDALEDYEKDIKNNNFNAVKTAFGINTEKVSPEIKNEVNQLLLDLKEENKNLINSLPIPEEKKELFNKQLRVNLGKRLMLNISQTCNAVCSINDKDSEHNQNDKSSINLNKKDKTNKKRKNHKENNSCCDDCDCTGCDAVCNCCCDAPKIFRSLGSCFKCHLGDDACHCCHICPCDDACCGVDCC